MLLELQHVIKRFHDKELLHIPVWQIHQGQRIGLIGANGCGKTTLLRILQGVCVVEEGVCIFWTSRQAIWISRELPL